MAPNHPVYGYNFDPQGSLVNRVANWITQYNISGYGPRLYDAYGKQLWEETDLTIFPYFPFKFKGQAGYISDLNTGLVYCWHRYYDPKIGRWISRDPIGLEGGINNYAYCSGNPIMFADPNGLDTIIIVGGVASGDPNHDKVTGNFLRAALKYASAIREKDTKEKITLLWMWEPYHKRWGIQSHFQEEDKISPFRSIGVEIVGISSATSVIDQLRSQGKGSIDRLAYFGHSGAKTMLLDYGYASVGQGSISGTLTLDMLANNRSLASRFSTVGAFYAFGCNQGDIGGIAQSMSYIWNVESYGSMGKTDFESMLTGGYKPKSAKRYVSYNKFGKVKS